MTTANLNESDVLIRYSRRSLWTALTLILLLGAGAVGSIGFPGTEVAVMANRLWLSLPIVIVIAVAALKSSAKGARTDPSSPGMKAILNDELRQDSLNRAYRNAFGAILTMQPLLAMAQLWTAFANPAPLMACMTVMAGVAVMLASLLYYDR
jgi:hypothetical protein